MRHLSLEQRLSFWTLVALVLAVALVPEPVAAVSRQWKSAVSGWWDDGSK